MSTRKQKAQPLAPALPNFHSKQDKTKKRNGALTETKKNKTTSGTFSFKGKDALEIGRK